MPEGETEGFVVPVSFENLMPRACKFDRDTLRTSESDYEEFIVQGPEKKKCLNGE